MLVRRKLRKGLTVLCGCNRIPRYLAQTVQVLRAVVGTQVGPVTPQGPVLHQGILEEHLLARLDVGPGKHHGALRIHGLHGYGRSVRVGQDCDKG